MYQCINIMQNCVTLKSIFRLKRWLSPTFNVTVFFFTHWNNLCIIDHLQTNVNSYFQTKIMLLRWTMCSSLYSFFIEVTFYIFPVDLNSTLVTYYIFPYDLILIKKIQGKCSIKKYDIPSDILKYILKDKYQAYILKNRFSFYFRMKHHRGNSDLYFEK